MKRRLFFSFLLAELSIQAFRADVKVESPTDYVRQMLKYGKEYSFL